jgi:UDP-N-acetylmuramate--alanine ligase
MFRKARHLHFVGIGGTGMSGIAEVLVNLGYRVSGSDLQATEVTRRLKRLGAKVSRGHSARHVDAADVVVVSSAVKPDNAEIVEARRRRIPVIPRAEMLAEIMRMKYGIAVAGAHGKTSTTAMIAAVLTAGGLDPTVVIGGRIRALRSGAKVGRGEFMVAEADESDGSFLKMKPTVAVVTNIDREHLDHYHDLGEIEDTFVQFLARVPFYGAAVVCLDDANVRAIVPRIDRKIVTYGLSSDADVTATDLAFSGYASRFTVRLVGAPLGPVRLGVPGRHSVANALAAIAVGLELDVPFARIARAIASFRPVERRFQARGEAFGATLVDDYGHHPTEIQATLAAAREGFGARTVVVFQPHRYTRTRALLEEFGRAFVLADHVLVTDVYAAGEAKIPGVDGAAVAAALVRHGHPSVAYEPDLDLLPSRLRSIVRPGDLVLTLGAGNVTRVADRFLALSAGSARASRAARPRARRSK